MLLSQAYGMNVHVGALPAVGSKKKSGASSVSHAALAAVKFRRRHLRRVRRSLLVLPTKPRPDVLFPGEVRQAAVALRSAKRAIAAGRSIRIEQPRPSRSRSIPVVHRAPRCFPTSAPAVFRFAPQLFAVQNYSKLSQGVGFSRSYSPVSCFKRSFRILVSFFVFFISVCSF